MTHDSQSASLRERVTAVSPTKPTSTLLVVVSLIALVQWGLAQAAGALPPPYDELVQVKSRRLDAIYLLPGADFSGYRKIMIDPVQVAFRKDWVQQANRSRGMSLGFPLPLPISSSMPRVRRPVRPPIRTRSRPAKRRSYWKCVIRPLARCSALRSIAAQREALA